MKVLSLRGKPTLHNYKLYRIKMCTVNTTPLFTLHPNTLHTDCMNFLRVCILCVVLVLTVCLVYKCFAYRETFARFTCPDNSEAVSDDWAPAYFGDCQCVDGYEKNPDKDGCQRIQKKSTCTKWKPTGKWINNPGMLSWCNRNCKSSPPYCPKTHCECASS